jgi:hypothetical protein
MAANREPLWQSKRALVGCSKKKRFCEPDSFCCIYSMGACHVQSLSQRAPGKSVPIDHRRRRPFSVIRLPRFWVPSCANALKFLPLLRGCRPIALAIHIEDMHIVGLALDCPVTGRATPRKTPSTSNHLRIVVDCCLSLSVAHAANVALRPTGCERPWWPRAWRAPMLPSFSRAMLVSDGAITESPTCTPWQPFDGMQPILH